MATEAVANTPASVARRRCGNKWDSNEVKRVLDECAAVVVEDAGYEQNFFVSNVKIGLGLLTCATALVAQFYPMPFPDNYWLLLACVVAYFLLNTLLQAFVFLHEGDIILTTHSRQPLPFGLALSSSMPRYSDIYTLTLRAKDAHWEVKPVRSICFPLPPFLFSRSRVGQVELCKSVSCWIYEDGEVEADILKADVLALLERFEMAALQARSKKD
jgi:signal peptidase complex subunit 2